MKATSWIPRVGQIVPMINDDGTYSVFVENEMVEIPQGIFEKLFRKLTDEEQQELEVAMELIERERNNSNFTREIKEEMSVKDMKNDPLVNFISALSKKADLSREEFKEKMYNKIIEKGYNPDDVGEEYINKIYDELME